MRYSRFLRAQTAAALGALALAGTAAAERAAPTDLDARYHPDLTQRATAADVVVHYTTAANNPSAVSAADAARLAQTFQSAVQTETRWGFPPPARDNGLGGDDRLDVYVATAPAKRSFTQADLLNWPVSAAIQLDPSDVKSWRKRFHYRGTIAHELFHAIQAQFMAGDPSPYIFEATAEWAGFRV